MTRNIATSRALRNVLFLGRLLIGLLLIGLLLMHGLRLGHAALPPPHPVAAAQASDTGSETHAGMGADTADRAHAGFGAGHESTPHGDGSDHQGVTQMCLAVLGGLALAVLLVRRLRGAGSLRQVRPRRQQGPLLVWTSRPPDRPSIYRLCVIRT